jgi:hypothetical protein
MKRETTDANYATGTWYGYNIRRKLSDAPLPNLKMAVNEQANMPDMKDSTK